MTADTIVALSSGSPPAAIAVIRLSGPEATVAARAVAGPLPPPRRAGLRDLRDADGDLLDRALVLAFPAPRTATGEDLVEFHCHGGRAVVVAVEAALIAHPGVRRAHPGEFTRRALANGRIDLIEAEGLADLLQAETHTERRAALAAAEGRVSRAVDGWARQIADLSARVEAAIDYAEEGEVEAAGEGLLAGVTHDAKLLADEVAAMLAQPPVERWRDGWRIVVAGPPNAGKSTLVNAMTERDAALVSPVAGTTRDRIEVAVRRAGVGYVLVDTAGLRDDAADPVEQAGIALAARETAAADMLLWLGDGPAPRADALIVRAKADLRFADCAWPDDAVSAIMPASVEALWRRVEARLPVFRADLLPMTQAVRDACADAAKLIRDLGADEIVAAERLRLAAGALARVLGYDATEMMLDALFARFCLGK